MTINEFIWNQIKKFMSPLPNSLMYGFFAFFFFFGGGGGGGGVVCSLRGLEALACGL